MNLLLVSGRDGGRGLRLPADRVVALANEHAAAGHGVRWLQPVPPGADARPAALDAAVEHRAIVSAAPPFRAVQARGTDPFTEAALVEELRRVLPDWTVCLDAGGATSFALSWAVKTMGGQVAVHVDPRALLCHRGTLVDWNGDACDTWDDGKRCAHCCRQPFEGGLGGGQAALARLCRPFGAWSPFPESHQFRFRMDYALYALEIADAVLVESDADVATLGAAGIRRGVRVVTDWAALPGALAERPRRARASRTG